MRTPVVAPEPLAPPVGFTTQGVGERSRNSTAPFSFEASHSSCSGSGRPAREQDLVHGGLVEREPQRDGVVERHPVAPDARAPVAGAQLEELAVDHAAARRPPRPPPAARSRGRPTCAGRWRAPSAAPPRGGAGARSARRSSAACRAARPARGPACPAEPSAPISFVVSPIALPPGRHRSQGAPGVTPRLGAAPAASPPDRCGARRRSSAGPRPSSSQSCFPNCSEMKKSAARMPTRATIMPRANSSMCVIPGAAEPSRRLQRAADREPDDRQEQRRARRCRAPRGCGGTCCARPWACR